MKALFKNLVGKVLRAHEKEPSSVTLTVAGKPLAEVLAEVRRENSGVLSDSERAAIAGFRPKLDAADGEAIPAPHVGRVDEPAPSKGPCPFGELSFLTCGRDIRDCPPDCFSTRTCCGASDG